MKRRDLFLRTSAAGAIALDPFPHHLFAGSTKAASDRVNLGPMGVPLSRLAMGTGTNGSTVAQLQTGQERGTVTAATCAGGHRCGQR